MNFSIFLIILGFTESVYSSNINYTGNVPCPVCTLSYFRRKRANVEYTRWNSNLETTEEFIVQVLEDDITTTKNAIAAVNIEANTKSEEKIIIGGAVIPSPTTEFTLDPLKEYTRFIPPTPPSVAKFDGNIVLAPIKSNNKIIPPIRPKGIEIKHSGRHSQHKQSLLASPKYLQRSQTLIAQQFAPIVPVSFTRHNEIGPLTPRTVDNFILQKTTMRPTRTFSYPDVEMPTRTTKFIFPFEYNSKLYEKLTPLRSTSSPEINFYCTSISSKTTDKDMESKYYDLEDYRKSNRNKKLYSANKTSEKDHELYYNNLFYNEDDDIQNAKKQPSPTETFEDNVDISKFIIKIDASGSTDNATNTDGSQVTYEYQDEVKKTTIKASELKNVTKEKKKLSCSVLKSHPLTFSTPQSLHEIVTQLKQWAEESPVAKWLDITNGNYTVMENPIYMMIVDDPSSGQIVSAKQTVMIVAGIQGRDHHAVTAAMYLLYQLIERTETHSDLLSKFRFWIIPVFNPDGFDYSMAFPHRREWSKNLRQTWDYCKGRDSCKACEDYGIRCTIQPCYGVNLDRNFEYQWIPPEELRADHPCGLLYAGPRQLSEAETEGLTHYLHDQRPSIYTFIVFKEGDVLGILYPYSHTNKKRAYDHIHRQRASRAASAAYSINGRPYVAGQTSEFLPLYAGGIEDWVDGHLGIDNTYTVMMFRPSDALNSKLATERVVLEAYAAVDTLLLHSIEPFVPPQITLTRARAALSTVPSRFSVLLIFLTLGYG